MPENKPDAFLKFLRGLSEDRGAMAVLRRTLASDADGRYQIRAARYIEPFLIGVNDQWQRSSYYLVAGLYALHPEESDRKFAEVLGEIWQSRDCAPSLEGRFLALLESDTDQLAHRLRMLVQLVRSQTKVSAGLDYAELLSDVLRWRWSDRPVQRRWAREFYGRRAETPGPTGSENMEVQA